LIASQGNSLAVEHRHSVAQMHEQVVITIEVFVQQKLPAQSDAILHTVPALKQSAPPLCPSARERGQ
jgi:hypothetical protein